MREREKNQNQVLDAVYFPPLGDPNRKEQIGAVRGKKDGGLIDGGLIQS